MEGQRDNEYIIYCVMWDLRFPQWSCCIFNSSGMWQCCWSVIPTFWRVKNAFFYNVKQLHPISEVTIPSKRWELLTQWHSITSQMTWMFILLCSSCAPEAWLLWKFQSIRHLDIAQVVCYKFGLSITVSWLLLNKLHCKHSSGVNIALMYHPVEEWLYTFCSQ